MDIRHKNASMMLLRECVGLINSGTTVGRAMTMIGDRSNVCVDMLVKVAASLPMVDPTGNHVPQMGNHACGHKKLASLVVIDSPRVAESVRDDLETIFGGMVSPDTAVNVDGCIGKLNVFGKRIVVSKEFPAAFGLTNS